AEELDELGLANAARVGLAGPAVSLKPKAAIVIGLALHELVSNARRYGALSNGRGRGELHWSLGTAEDGDAPLSLTWRETGGPSVAAPANNGFGREIFERQLPSEIGAAAGIDFAPKGVEAGIALPLSSGMVVTDGYGSP